MSNPNPHPQKELTWLIVMVVPAAVFWSQGFLWPRCSCEGWVPPPLNVLAPAWHSGVKFLLRDDLFTACPTEARAADTELGPAARAPVLTGRLAHS